MFTVYGSQDCPWCEKVENLILDNDEEYLYIDVSEDEHHRAYIVEYLEKIQKRVTVPQVFLGGQYIGGYEDTVEYLGRTKDV